MSGPKPVLQPGRIYATYDRSRGCRCAGMTATYTGVTIGGYKVRPVDQQDRIEWATYDLGPIRCDCGKLSMDCATGTITTKEDSAC